MYIFISYSSKNTDEATNICNKLEKAGQKCFLAFRDIAGGSVYAEELVNAIDSSDAFLLLLSEGSNNSPHVLREVERACSKNIPMVVYKLENVALTKSLEYFLMTHQWVTKEDGDERLIGVFENLGKRQQNLENSGNSEPAVVGHKEKKSSQMSGKKLLIPAFIGIVIIAALVVLVAAISKNGEKLPVETGNETVNQSSFAEETDLSERVRQMKPGDSITIGSYRGEPIEWMALHKNDDGSTILISKEIICLKMFDAPESGVLGTCTDEALLNGAEALENSYWTDSKADKYGAEALIEAYGNNDWSVSNIRNWLNADQNLVHYEDSAPGNISQGEKTPFYSDEKGFLTNFTDDEKSALSEYAYTYVNSITGEENDLSDKVFLLSEQELDWFYQEDISPLAKVTEGALEEDYEGNYANYNKNGYFYWWLRDGSENVSCMNRYVSNSMDNPVNEYLSSYYGYGGIRPCICIR